MSTIVLATLNARFAHASFGLRYLLANIGSLAPETTLLEFEASRVPLDVATAILECRPRIVGLSAYIWNIGPLTQVAGILKRLEPEVRLVVGGPELGSDPDELELGRLADVAVTGEADHTFREVCERILRGDPVPHHVVSPTPDLANVALPYHLYTDEDLAHRVIYVEASRGCPYSCEFCLSALPVPVRAFELERLLGAFATLLERGARTFKFVDRTFNLDVRSAGRILDFFLERWTPDLHLHFEMVPDRLPDELRRRLAGFPPGAVQLEVGIQSFSDEVNRRISRRQNTAKTEDNLRWLRDETGCHLHTDLIVGLPGEDLGSVARSFDRLMALGPHEIQVGILKRLRGTPILRHDEAFGMIYSPYAPYEILRTAAISSTDLDRMRRFARYFDAFVNSGQFPSSAPLLFEGVPSSFAAFLEFSDRLHARLGRAFALALSRQAECLFDHLVLDRRQDASRVGAALAADWTRAHRSERPPFLEPYLPSGGRARRESPKPTGRQRQDRRRTDATPDPSSATKTGGTSS